MSLSSDLLFHVESCTTSNEIWTTLESLFGKQDTMRGFQLKNELIGLNPRDFDSIQEFFTKLKSLRLNFS